MEMAQKIEVQLLDDLDGSEAIGTTVFVFDGVEYAIDLNQENMERFNAFMQIHAEAGRRTGGRKTRSKTAAPKTNTEAQTIREWVRAQGHEISDRGRIPQKWVEEYHQAQNVAQQPTQTPEEPIVKPVEESKPTRKSRAPRKPAAPAFQEALAEVLTLDTTKEKKAAPRRTTTKRATKSTTK